MDRAVTNYFRGAPDHPEHLSVGAVLINEKGEICVHHFTDEDKTGYWADESINNFYILMRATLVPGESLEEAVERGLLDEFGATAEVLDYVGSIRSGFTHFVKKYQVRKTTLYFLCRLLTQKLERRDSHDIEGRTSLEWRTPDFLIPKMREQREHYGRDDIDESPIIEKVRTKYSHLFTR